MCKAESTWTRSDDDGRDCCCILVAPAAWSRRAGLDYDNKRTDSPRSSSLTGNCSCTPEKRAACPRLSERISRLCRDWGRSWLIDVEVEACEHVKLSLTRSQHGDRESSRHRHSSSASNDLPVLLWASSGQQSSRGDWHVKTAGGSSAVCPMTPSLFACPTSGRCTKSTSLGFGRRVPRHIEVQRSRLPYLQHSSPSFLTTLHQTTPFCPPICLSTARYT